MNMMTTLNLRAMVSNENGEPKTTSYAVAEAFKKRHSDVLRAIKNMKCSQKFRERNFALCFENNKLQNGKPRKFYQMTKDGWMFLVMGFNGEKAARSRRYEQGTPLALSIADLNAYCEQYELPVERYIFNAVILDLDNRFIDEAYKKASKKSA